MGSDQTGSRKGSTMKTRNILLLVVLMMVATLAIGCSAEQLDQLQAERQTVTEVRNATTQAAADLQAEIATLPPDDPVRKATEKKLVKLNEVLAKIDLYLPKIDAAIAAAGTGDFTGPSMREAVRDIPYGGLVLTVFGIGYGIFQRMQKDKERKALTQVVNGIDVAMPTKSEPVKAALESAQDASTKVRVAEIRAA